MIKDINITEEFQKAFDEMEFTHNNIFVTGKAGTGKSTLLQFFRNSTSKNIAVLAPTGVAAVNVKGQTIHSFFKFSINVNPDNVKKIRSQNGIYKKLDAIVIDEISMVRADLMDCIDKFLRLNGKYPNLPFGGVQLICFGDLYQLPPVVTNEDTPVFFDSYISPYFFDSHVFNEIEYSIIELGKVFRQTDDTFIYALNKIREGKADEEVLSIINSRFDNSSTFSNDETYIYLTTVNKKADTINANYLQGIKEKEYVFHGESNGDFNEKDFPAPAELKLKVGAQVMMITNDSDGRWVNGTLGKVSKLNGEHIFIIINGKEEEADPYEWEKYQYIFDEESGKVKEEITGTYMQYPLKLAWAVTIHKSQGKTFDKVIIDLGFGAFAHGQVYVALSRCTTLEGIILKRRVTSKDIFVEERIIDFLGIN